MRQVVSIIKQQFQEFNRIRILDFIMEHPDRRPSFEKALEADVLYALTQVDKDAAIKGSSLRRPDMEVRTS